MFFNCDHGKTTTVPSQTVKARNSFGQLLPVAIIIEILDFLCISIIIMLALSIYDIL